MPQATTEEALTVLRRSIDPVHGGFVAVARSGEPHPTQVTLAPNYQNVWSRDACICGLAALSSHQTPLIDALERSLEILARNIGPSGQVPSNVRPVSGRSADDHVSYGRSAGRVDATIWFVIGVCLLGRLGRREDRVRHHWPQLLEAVRLLRAWEFNAQGLLYVPQGGDWADEYVLSGYVLYDQVLRLWSLRELAGAALRLELAPGLDAPRLTQEGRHRVDDHLFVPGIIEETFLRREGPPYFIAGVRPEVRCTRFDALGNALACLLGLGSDETRRRVLDHGMSIRRHGLVPAFDPPIRPGDHEYRWLAGATTGRLRNRPGRYHNGGLWPMVNGFWALALARHGRGEDAKRVARAIARANAVAHESGADPRSAFCEYLDATTGAGAGSCPQAWSAAAQIYAVADPGTLFISTDDEDPPSP